MNITALQSLSSSADVKNISNSNGVQSGTDTKSASLNEAKDVYTSNLAEIAAKYDVKHMSANQIGEMAQELKDKGLISTPDFLSMSLLPYLMEGNDAGAAAATATDGSVDLIKYWNIKSVKPSDAESGLKLFDSLIKSKTSYMDAIKNTTVDPLQVANVLDALAAHRTVNVST